MSACLSLMAMLALARTALGKHPNDKRRPITAHRLSRHCWDASDDPDTQGLAPGQALQVGSPQCGLQALELNPVAKRARCGIPHGVEDATRNMDPTMHQHRPQHPHARERSTPPGCRQSEPRTEAKVPTDLCNRFNTTRDRPCHPLRLGAGRERPSAPCARAKTAAKVASRRCLTCDGKAPHHATAFEPACHTSCLRGPGRAPTRSPS